MSATTATPNKFVVGLCDHEEVYLHAIEHIRAKGIEIYDSLTPFPVHGLEDALGYKESRLHTAGFFFGMTGTTLALVFMSWVMTTNYPINVGGKPMWPLPSFSANTLSFTSTAPSFVQSDLISLISWADNFSASNTRAKRSSVVRLS